MKGVVFTEFLEMVEEKFSPDMAERVIENAKLARIIHHGCGNAAGSCSEDVRRVGALGAV